MSKIDLYPNLKSPPAAAKVATGTAWATDKFGMDVNVLGGTVTGELSPTGLKNGGRMTTMEVTDTATMLPPVALTGRNSMKVTNLSTTETMYVGFDALVTADRAIGNTAGDELGPNEAINFDVTDEVPIYAIAESGKTILIKIMELA